MKTISLTVFSLLLTLAAHAQWGTVTGATSNYRSTFSGNLGIGTGTSTVPADKLEVAGNVRSNQFNAINGIFNVPNTTSDLFLRTNGVTRLLISRTNGFIKIGSTDAPLYSLDVAGTIYGVEVRNAYGVIVSSPWTKTASNINYTAGIVSIGTTMAPAGYKLAIGGKTLTEEVVVKLQANWPDYVFAPTYNLMPLNQLEAYINLNKHLPEVPSAKNVADNGVALGEMNATLLKKIEELTLYVIELKKGSEVLQEQIEAQQRQIEALQESGDQ